MRQWLTRALLRVARLFPRSERSVIVVVGADAVRFPAEPFAPRDPRPFWPSTTLPELDPIERSRGDLEEA